MSTHLSCVGRAVVQERRTWTDKKSGELVRALKLVWLGGSEDARVDEAAYSAAKEGQEVEFSASLSFNRFKQAYDLRDFAIKVGGSSPAGPERGKA